MFSTGSIIPQIVLSNKRSFHLFAIHPPSAEEGEFLLYYVKGTQIKNSNRNLNFECLFEFFSFFLKIIFLFYFSSFFIPAFSRIPFHICSRFFSRSAFPSFHFCINAICSRSSRSSINSLSFLHLFR